MFETPARAEGVCGVTGTYVQRIVGLPGERVELRLVAGREHVFVDGRKLEEADVGESRRGFGPERVFRVPDGPLLHARGQPVVDLRLAGLGHPAAWPYRRGGCLHVLAAHGIGFR